MSQANGRKRLVEESQWLKREDLEPALQYTLSKGSVDSCGVKTKT